MTRRRNYQERINRISYQINFPENEEDFRNISLYPKNEDIYSEPPELCKIITKGSYRSLEHYLYTNFKVLREDFIGLLRQAIGIYRSQALRITNGGCLKINNIEIYKKVRFFSCNRLCFDVLNQIREDDWSSTKRFMTGSLLLFTNDNFNSFFLATVANTEVNDLKRKFITVDLVDKDDQNLVVNKTFTMIESESFFTPYYHVLKAMQGLNEHNFPFKKYLVDVNFKLQPPSYLKSNEGYIIKTKKEPIRFKVLDDSKWPTPNQLGLDVSQFTALKAALTNELVVIQGPPGTGKTFIGLKIVEALLTNAHLWNQNRAPILVVCVTNHALDQFLEGILSFTKRLIRIGKNQGGKLEEFNFREQRKKYGRQYGINIDVEILRSALVIGTTTTLAAKHRELLGYVAPKIVIVEEAAEVLETHVIASLSSECQHLIMIGDHQQLRPNVSDVKSAQKYKLDVSLFERLILNDMPYHMLVSQHRMRPEISKMLVLTIYPKLQNHFSVLDRENIKGMDKNVFFMTHNSTEEQAESTSKKNDFETMILLNLAKYLVQQGYEAQDITILATYKGQTNYMEEKSKSLKLPSEIRITTVDNYQGEENKIVLLSLVRSNSRNDVGFLRIDNRICVALSRARDGFFIVGNMDCLVARSHTWTVLKDCLIEQQSFGPSLKLRCQIHKEKVSVITCPEDFTSVSHGGCRWPCGLKLKCGHICKYRCHGLLKLQAAHKIITCTEPCTRVCSRGHRCGNQCFQPCETCPCNYVAPRLQFQPRDSYVQPVSRATTVQPVVTLNTTIIRLNKQKWWQSCTLM